MRGRLLSSPQPCSISPTGASVSCLANVHKPSHQPPQHCATGSPAETSRYFDSPSSLRSRSRSAQCGGVPRWSFAGWAFSKEKISPSGQVRSPSNAPRLHICSTSRSQHLQENITMSGTGCLVGVSCSKSFHVGAADASTYQQSGEAGAQFAKLWRRLGGDCSVGSLRTGSGS